MLEVYASDGGPLNPKEMDSEKMILQIAEIAYSENTGETVFILKTSPAVYGAITTLLSQWQFNPETLSCGELESVKVLLTKSV